MTEEIKHGNCLKEAYLLKERNTNTGNVYWVVCLDGNMVYHAYYVPQGCNLDDLALNQADNGYPHYPALTCRQVLENGALMTFIENYVTTSP